MQVADIIQLALLIVTSLSTIASIKIAIDTLKQNSETIKDSSRAYIIFYIDYHPQTGKYYLVIKNFGNSIGKLKYVKIHPKLKSSVSGVHPLTEATNILLAPNQKVSSWFNFKNYQDKIFEIELQYETLNTTYTEKYKINLSYIDNTNWLYSCNIDDQSSDYKKVLYEINDSILNISDRID